MSRGSNLIRFMVELLIVLGDLGFLRIVPDRDELVELDFFPPLLTVNEPVGGQRNVLSKLIYL